MPIGVADSITLLLSWMKPISVPVSSVVKRPA